jgi:hypothetical protein
MSSVDTNGFNNPVFLRAGEGVIGVSAFNGASNVVSFGGVGFDVTQAAGTFTVANDGVVSVVAGTGGVTVTGTAQNPIISATAGTVPQTMDIPLGQFVGTVISGGGTDDTVFTSPTPATPLAPGVYLMTFSWKIPFGCLISTNLTYSYAQLFLNGVATGQLMKSTLVGGSYLTAGGEYPGFKQTVTGIVVLPAATTIGYTVVMTNSVLVNGNGSLCSYSAVRIA